MKNWEKYEMGVNLFGWDFGVTKKGEMNNCIKMECEDCILNENDICSKRRIEWLYKEYEEPKPKLTIDEKVIVQSFCENNYYIARDKDGLLWIYDFKPVQHNSEWGSADDSVLSLNDKLFQFITWESGKSWSIAELIELEVKE